MRRWYGVAAASPTPLASTEHCHNIEVDRGSEPMHADTMAEASTTLIKRLVLRAVLNDVSPLVARVLAVPDDLELTDLHDVFLAMLNWDDDPGFIIRIHAQEFNSFRRNTRGRRLRDFTLHRQEKFRYICDTLDLWEWEIRVLDVEPMEGQAVDIVCLKGCGAVPPARCGGPTDYRLMLKRQQAGPELTDPASISASVRVFADAYQGELGADLPFLENTLQGMEARRGTPGTQWPTHANAL